MSLVDVDSRPTISPKRIQVVLVVATVSVVAAYLCARSAMVSYVRDDWQFLSIRQSLEWSDLIRGHNGHWVFTPNVILLAWFKTVGLAHHALYSALGTAWHLAAVLAAGMVMVRRAGFVTAYVCGLFLAASSTGFEVWSWGAGFGFSGSILFGILAVYCFDRFLVDGGHRWRVLLTVSLLLSLSTQGAGAPLVFALGVVVLAHRRRRELWWTVVVPIGLYLALYAYWQFSYNVTGANIPWDPGWLVRIRYVADGMGWSVASPLGLGLRWGYALLVLMGALVVNDVLRNGFEVRRMLWPAAFFGYWALTSWQRGAWYQPQTSRYLWCGMILAVLAVVDLMPRVPVRRFVKPPLIAGILAGIIGVSAVSWNNAEAGMTIYRDESVRNKMIDSVAVRSRDRIPASSPVHSFWNVSLINAGPYFHAIDLYGQPPLFSLEQMSSDENRALADQSLADLGLLRSVLRTTVNECRETGWVSSIAVPPGGVTKFRVVAAGQAIVTRFLDPGAATTFNVVDVVPGVWEVRAPRDGLVRPTTVAFGGATVETCGEG